MIPEKAQGKVNQATVVAVGPGAPNKVWTAISVLVRGKQVQCFIRSPNFVL